MTCKLGIGFPVCACVVSNAALHAAKIATTIIRSAFDMAGCTNFDGCTNLVGGRRERQLEIGILCQPILPDCEGPRCGACLLIREDPLLAHSF